MNEKHLAKGSSKPELDPEKLHLYSMRFCPYCHRVQLALAAKNVPFDIVNINLKSKPDWLFEKNPLGKVPALEVGDKVLYESLVVADFVDEQYPEPPLYPSDPFAKAKDRILIQHFNQVIDAMYKPMTGKVEGSSQVLNKILDGLDIFEKELVVRGTPYFGGDRPGMVDYMIWPWCERAKVPAAISGAEFQVPKERYPKMMAWKAEMAKDEAVKTFFLDSDTHVKFLQTHGEGNPNFDMLAQ